VAFDSRQYDAARDTRESSSKKIFSPAKIALAHWLSSYYVAGMADETALPNDLAACHAMLSEHARVIATLRSRSFRRSGMPLCNSPAARKLSGTSTNRSSSCSTLATRPMSSMPPRGSLLRPTATRLLPPLCRRHTDSRGVLATPTTEPDSPATPTTEPYSLATPTTVPQGPSSRRAAARCRWC